MTETAWPTKPIQSFTARVLAVVCVDGELRAICSESGTQWTTIESACDAPGAQQAADGVGNSAFLADFQGDAAS